MEVSGDPLIPHIPTTRLDILTNGFWKVNHTKQFISTRLFLEALSGILRTDTPAVFASRLPRQDLLSILIQDLSLEMHGFTDSLHVSPLFENWSSVNKSDLPFGAKLWTDPEMHRGSNAFFFHGPNDRVNTPGLLEVLSESLATNLSTRFVCLVPSQVQLPPHFLELASIRMGCPLFGFAREKDCFSECPMSIILAANKHSLLADPINWENFVHRLQNWSSEFISIPPLTDALFRERVGLSHAPRSLAKHPHTVTLNSTSIMHFYDPFALTERIQNSRLVPPRAAELITQGNKHPRFLSLLGILPNQLRTLLKETDYENREEALSELSRTLFFAGFRIWKKRQLLASRYWKDIAPQNRQLVHPKYRKRKKRKIEDNISASNCKNPFHFLHRHCNLSKKRPTKCPCSIVPITEVPNQRITTFFQVSAKPSKIPLDPTFFISRTDKIREQHDRGKRRKVSHSLDYKHRKKENM